MKVLGGRGRGMHTWLTLPRDLFQEPRLLHVSVELPRSPLIQSTSSAFSAYTDITARHIFIMPVDTSLGWEVDYESTTDNSRGRWQCRPAGLLHRHSCYAASSASDTANTDGVSLGELHSENEPCTLCSPKAYLPRFGG